MSRRALGGLFCLIAAVLYVAYFICAAILGAGKLLPIYDASFAGLTVGAWAFFIAGFVFIILAEVEAYRNKN